MIDPTEDDIGRSVIYIPNHANDDINHQDCEVGRISSFTDLYVFVRYHLGDTAAATERDKLRWACS